jgi:hypothetical protein
MFGKGKQPKNEDHVITGRGPGSGSGQPLPDDEAIAILDERVEKPRQPSPDVGVVIDPSRSAEPISWTPPHRQATKPAEPMFDPAGYTDFEYYCARKQRMFEPNMPNWIVIADKLETPLHSILECTYPIGKAGRSWHARRLRLLLGNEAIDLDLPQQILPGLTLLDLVRDQD